MLYTLVVLIGNAIYQRRGIIPESTACYVKSHLTFSDLLEAVRRELGDVTNITNSILNTESAFNLSQLGEFEHISAVVGF